MRSVTVRLDDLRTTVLNLGFVGENEHTQIRIDSKKMFDQYPTASPSLTVCPPEGESYPAVIERDGDFVLWMITDSDLVSEGSGEIQLSFTISETVAKSYIGRFKVSRSLIPTGEIPSGLDDFITRADQLLDQVEDTFPAGGATGQVLAKKSDTDYDTEWVDQGGGTEDYDELENRPQIGGVTLTGNKTLHDLGAATEEAVTAKYTKPSSGIPASDMASGVIPVLTDLIDDTAGSGDTNKVWSADKSSILLTEINSTPNIKDSHSTGIDLDVSDESGNVIVRMKDGQIQTKEFNSKYTTDIKQSEKTGVDLDVSDVNGRVIARFQNGHVKTANFNSAKHGAKIITIKSDGTGDFTTFRAAIDSITDADPDTNPYEIHVYPGTYNTLEGFTEEEIQSADIGGGYTDQSMVGAKTKDGVSIIGIGNRDHIILTAELNTTDYSSGVRGNISTLNCKGTGRFENLTIKAKNIRYCVHDDFACDHQYQRVFKNCAFFGVNLSYNPATTYGGGIATGGMIGLFESCDFGYDWGLHARQGGTGCSVVEVRNCIGNKLRIGDPTNNDDTGYANFIINVCNFKKLVYAKSNGTTQHIDVSGSGNTPMMETVPTGFIIKCGDIVKTKCTSTLPVGTMVGLGSGASFMSKASDAETALGVIVGSDDNYDYVQTKGYINSALVNITGLSIGDYVTVDSDMALTATGATSSNAVGVVKWVDSDSNAYIWMLKGDV